MVTGETLLRLAAFAFLCTLVVTHRPTHQVVVVERDASEEKAPFDRVADNDRALDESGPASTVHSCLPIPVRINRALVDSIERDPWQLLNPSLLAAFGLMPGDKVTKIEKVGQPGDPADGQNSRLGKLLSLHVVRGAMEFRHDIYITD